MSKLHRHKWRYLSKEIATVETEKSFHMGMITGGSSRETSTQEVTYVKRFCQKCGEINVQTIPGKLLTKDLQVRGYYDE